MCIYRRNFPDLQCTLYTCVWYMYVLYWQQDHTLSTVILCNTQSYSTVIHTCAVYMYMYTAHEHIMYFRIILCVGKQHHLELVTGCCVCLYAVSQLCKALNRSHEVLKIMLIN